MRSILLLIALALYGCSDRKVQWDKVQPDTRPSFTLNSSRPFRIEFGRGSGWHGLDTVQVSNDGTVKMYRIGAQARTETTTFSMPAGKVEEVAGLVNSLALTSMGRVYSRDVHDGTQWVLWIQQPPHEKAIYFNNSFPEEIKAFAKGLDAILRDAGSEKSTWTAVPPERGRDHEKAIWESIQPKE